MNYRNQSLPPTTSPQSTACPSLIGKHRHCFSSPCPIICPGYSPFPVPVPDRARTVQETVHCRIHIQNTVPNSARSSTWTWMPSLRRWSNGTTAGCEVSQSSSSAILPTCSHAARRFGIHTAMIIAAIPAGFEAAYGGKPCRLQVLQLVSPGLATDCALHTLQAKGQQQAAIP
jgi:hypothetical protein